MFSKEVGIEVKMWDKIQVKLKIGKKNLYFSCVFRINIQIECMEKLYAMNFPKAFTMVLLD